MAGTLIPWFGGDGGFDRHTRRELEKLENHLAVDRREAECIVDLTTHCLIGVGNIGALQQAVEKAVPMMADRLQMISDFGVARLAALVGGRR